MGHDIRANLQDLIGGLLSGRLMEVFEKHYHDDVVMSENGEDDATRHDKAGNRQYEAYFAAHAEWHGAKLGKVIVDADGNASAYEIYCDFTIGGARKQFTQCCVQEWSDGQIIRETFYYKA